VIASIHQSAYLPWLGYFDRIASSDVFIVLDSVQYEKNSFINRNRIKTARGPLWLTVPVSARGHFQTTLMDLEIDNCKDWKSKHLRSIAQNYRKAPYFHGRFERLTQTYNFEDRLLTELCFRQLEFWLEQLQIPTRILRASKMNANGRKSELICNLCSEVGATTYLSGPLGRNYLDEDQFSVAGITVRYHDYVHPQYSQLFGAFMPALSVVDYWLNSDDLSLVRGGR
jgi:hypothetical protein